MRLIMEIVELINTYYMNYSKISIAEPKLLEGKLHIFPF